MGKETQELNKRASNHFRQLLSNGVGLTYANMVVIARMDFGYTDRWVNKFLSDMEDFISQDDGGFFRWKM